MRLIFRYMRSYTGAIIMVMIMKMLGTLTELLIPYILEHMIDVTVPAGNMTHILMWGFLMILSAFITRELNVFSNRHAVENAHNISYEVRRDLFNKTANLSGSQFDAFGLPSLISRMTSDSYNIQSCTQTLQTLFVRAPIMMVGGILVTLTMDRVLSGLLCAMLPVLMVVIIGVSRYGIPLFHKVQASLDTVVRVMRENITGIRVVKALSKTDYEKRRFENANARMTSDDIKASTVMALPGPFMQLCLNAGLTLIVFIGARRINEGVMQPGVILAFLTYFNMILQGVMAVNRIFMMISRASASAERISLILAAKEDQPVLSDSEARHPSGEGFIRFEHVNFSYSGNAAGTGVPATAADGSGAYSAGTKVSATAGPGESSSDYASFGGERREQCLTDINFSINKGESLGIIGPTGCGKTTVINLLMRFYDVEDGGVFVDGRDVRSYEKDELRSRFGVVFQNDMVFNDTLRRNIRLGREISDDSIAMAVKSSMAEEYISGLENGLEYKADIKGANLSGGQKQRLLIARALAGNPEILVLDDSSSALDYKTDAALRKAIAENYAGTTTIIIAQRVSSIMNLSHIMVMDNGHCVGYGTHDELLRTCGRYRETFNAQMGALT